MTADPRSAARARRVVEPGLPVVAVVGRPNVGKPGQPSRGQRRSWRSVPV